jgi:hypothetical protein
MACAGKYSERDLPDFFGRNFEERGFTIGIGGYVVATQIFIISPLLNIILDLLVQVRPL